MQDPMREQVLNLLQMGMYESADILAQLYVSAVVPLELDYLNADALAMLGDAAFGKREYRRAVGWYIKALMQHRAGKKFPRKPAASGLPAFPEAEVRFKLAQCHAFLKENDQAIHELEQINPKSRDVRMNMMLARLLHRKGHARNAAAAYKECLKQCPYAMEAVIALADLQVAAKDIVSRWPEERSGRHLHHPTNPHASNTDPHATQKVLVQLADAHCSVASQDYRVALGQFGSLASSYKRSHYLHVQMAKAAAADGQVEEALKHFQTARTCDEHNLNGLDELAFLLKQLGQGQELNRLAHDMLNSDPRRVETWVAAALYWDAREDKGRAIMYADKAIMADEKHPLAYLVKGNLALAINQPEAALLPLKNANALRHDLRVFQGLVRAYLSGGSSKEREALLVAREAVKWMPHSPAALALLGNVHARQTDGRDKARRCYSDALRLNPNCVEAVMSMAELYQHEGKMEEALQLLEAQIKRSPSTYTHTLHAKMGDVLAAFGKHAEALTHFNAAISLNASSEAAKKGLERLEKMLKGLDPDALEEEEEVEASDADVDAEEPDFV